MRCTIEKIGEVYDRERKVKDVYVIRCEDGDVIPFEHTSEDVDEVVRSAVSALRSARGREKLAREFEV